MNGRKAKQLRRTAEAATRGAPMVEYQPQRVIHKPWMGPLGMQHFTALTERRLTAACTRGAYQALKRDTATKAIEFVGRRQTRAERQRAERDNPTLALTA